VASPNLDRTPNANVDNFGRELFVSLPRTADSNDVQLMDKFERPDKSDTAPRAPSCLFTLGSAAASLSVVVGNKEESALEANFRVFPSQVPTLTNCFTNQDEDLNENGFDSDGNLPHFANEQYNDMEGNIEDVIVAIDNQPSPIAMLREPALTVESVMKLGVKELKEELKKRGRAISGKKSELQDCLKEAVWLHVPVAGPSEEPQHESMGGLDMTTRWVPLTRIDEPIVVPGVNADQSHRPPTKQNQDVNPKYGFVKTVDALKEETN